MAMGILSALKLQEGSIQELAKLPQQQLVKMAQDGRINVNLLPVVLNEKAQMAQTAANMQAMAAPPKPSIMEQNMMVNAQADVPQLPRQSGIANLPMDEGTFTAAGGGIVAFAGGGVPTGIDKEFLAATGLSESDFGEGTQDSMYDQEVRAALRRRAPYLELTPEQQALQQYYDKLEGQSKADLQQNLWGRLAQAGLNIMGQTSPYALANIGAGAKEPMAGAMSDIAAQKKAKVEALKARAELADVKRKGSLEGVTAGEGLAKAKLDRLIAAGKPTDMRNYVDLYVAAEKEKIAAGLREPASDKVLGLEGNQDYLRRYGEATAKAQASLTSAGASATQAATALQEKQQKAWNTARLTDPNVARELAKARQKDKEAGGGTANQDAVRDAWIAKNYPGGQAPAAGAPANQPKASKTSGKPAPKVSAPSIDMVSGLPKDARFGKETSQGWEVFNKEGKLIGYAK